MKRTIATFTLAMVMTFGSTFANAGIIVADVNGSETCKEDTGIIVADIGGIIVADFGGIIVADFGGIIVADLIGCSEKVDNGIMISD